MRSPLDGLMLRSDDASGDARRRCRPRRQPPTTPCRPSPLPRPRARLPVPSTPTALRRAPLPQQLQLPDRRLASRGAGRARAALGYGALAITDECSLAGVVRAHLEAQAQQAAPRHRQRDAPDAARQRRAARAPGAARADAARLRQPLALDHGRAPARREGQLPRASRRRRGQGAERADARRPAGVPGAARALGGAAASRTCSRTRCG